jgi:hypothetical protein
MFQWSEGIAVGNLSYVEKLKSELGFKAAQPAAMRRFNSSRACPGPDPRSKVQVDTGLLEQEINGAYALRERSEVYRSNFNSGHDTANCPCLRIQLKRSIGAVAKNVLL